MPPDIPLDLPHDELEKACKAVMVVKQSNIELDVPVDRSIVEGATHLCILLESQGTKISSCECAAPR